jgi:hypothetical protein
MPASPYEASREALATLLAAANGAGSFTYDLSAAVTIGAPPDTVRASPAVWLWCDRIRFDTDTTIGDYVAVQEIDVIGFVAGADNTPTERMRAAERLAHDFHLAIRSDRGLAGTVRDVRFVEVLALDGESTQMGTRYGVCLVRVEITQDIDGVP